MNVTLTNLSNEIFNDSRFLLNNSANRHGINNINSYSYDDIVKTNFYRENKDILSNVKGAGYWLWKPYIILESLNQIAKNDIVVYADCGIEIANDLSPLIDICANKTPILIFGNGNDINAHWTKRDCFVLMNCDSPEYWFGPHCDASFSLWRKTNQTIEFLKEWLSYGCDERIISDNDNVCQQKNLDGYIEHRRDQSILSILVQKHKLNLYRTPTKFGNHYKEHRFRIPGEFNCINQSFQDQVDYYTTVPYYNSPYLQLLNHHRSKKTFDISDNPVILAQQGKPINQLQNFQIKKMVGKFINRVLKIFGYELKKF